MQDLLSGLLASEFKLMAGGALLLAGGGGVVKTFIAMGEAGLAKGAKQTVGFALAAGIFAGGAYLAWDGHKGVRSHTQTASLSSQVAEAPQPKFQVL